MQVKTNYGPFRHLGIIESTDWQLSMFMLLSFLHACQEAKSVPYYNVGVVIP